MRAATQFLSVIGKAAVVVTAAYLPLAYLADLATRGRRFSADGREAIIALVAVLPCILVAGWVFRGLGASYGRREALAVAIAFGVFAAMSFQPAIFYAQNPGTPADRALGGPLFWVALFTTVAAAVAVGNFVVCGLTLWIVRRVRAVPSVTR
jgi:hypothetical protein